jgi:hypothetical protein
MLCHRSGCPRPSDSRSISGRLIVGQQGTCALAETFRQSALLRLPRSGFILGSPRRVSGKRSFLEFGWRLSGILLRPKSSNAGLRRLSAMRKARIWRAFLIRKENSMKTGMLGWAGGFEPRYCDFEIGCSCLAETSYRTPFR